MKRKRIVLAGLGAMGRVWAQRVASSKSWEGVAYADPDPESRKLAQEKCGVPPDRCFDDLEKALRQTQADALLDVTPQQFRKDVCTAAFKHGLPVLCEKPLADNLQNAKTLVSRAAKAGVTFMVAQNYRYQAPTQTAKRYIDSGKLGRVGYVGVNFHKGPHFGGFRETMDFPLVLDMSIHHFDMMRCLLSADVVAVQAVSVNAPWNWNKGDATVAAVLEMSSGVVVNYYASWVASGAETPWNADWRFEGEKGVLLWENDALSVSNRPDAKRPLPLIKYPVCHQARLLEEFARALAEGFEPETSGRNNLNSLAATYAVVRAAREKRRVPMRELLA